jgi:predicted transcriptional regulator
VGIRAWFDRLRRREDAGALERAEELAEEPAEERARHSTDVEGLAADERAGRLAGETPTDVERLGE